MRPHVLLLFVVLGVLQQVEMTLEDVCFVHLYVKNMDDFGAINTEYCRHFGVNPPSRSCVEVAGLSGRVLMDCYALRGSGQAKMQQTRQSKRDVLHIQSISAWAPTCIGPYSQANIVKKTSTFLLLPTFLKRS